MICVSIIQQFADLFGTFPKKFQYYLSPFQNFWLNGKCPTSLVFQLSLSNHLIEIFNRIFNFRRGKGSKKSHISVSNVEQSHATSLFIITGSSFTGKASKLYKYFVFQAIEKLFIHLTNLCFAEFCKFLGDF